jgi:hypothetical protein
MDSLDKLLAELQIDLRRADEVIASGKRAHGDNAAADHAVELWKQWLSDTTAILKHYGRLRDVARPSR